MIYITLPAEEKEFAKKYKDLADFYIATEETRCFTGEQLAIISIGATFAAPLVQDLIHLLAEILAEKGILVIKIGSREFKFGKETVAAAEKEAEKQVPDINIDELKAEITKNVLAEYETKLHAKIEQLRPIIEEELCAKLEEKILPALLEDITAENAKESGNENK